MYDRRGESKQASEQRGEGEREGERGGEIMYNLCPIIHTAFFFCVHRLS